MLNKKPVTVYLNSNLVESIEELTGKTIQQFLESAFWLSHSLVIEEWEKRQLRQAFVNEQLGVETLSVAKQQAAERDLTLPQYIEWLLGNAG